MSSPSNPPTRQRGSPVASPPAELGRIGGAGGRGWVVEVAIERRSAGTCWAVGTTSAPPWIACWFGRVRVMCSWCVRRRHGQIGAAGISRAERVLVSRRESGIENCVVDNALLLDKTSALAPAFIARRRLAESIGLVFAVRGPSEAQELAEPPPNPPSRRRHRAGAGPYKTRGRRCESETPGHLHRSLAGNSPRAIQQIAGVRTAGKFTEVGLPGDSAAGAPGRAATDPYGVL
jgi:hypothetical protein